MAMGHTDRLSEILIPLSCMGKDFPFSFRSSIFRPLCYPCPVKKIVSKSIQLMGIGDIRTHFLYWDFILNERSELRNDNV